MWRYDVLLFEFLNEIFDFGQFDLVNRNNSCHKQLLSNKYFLSNKYLLRFENLFR